MNAYGTDQARITDSPTYESRPDWQTRHRLALAARGVWEGGVKRGFDPFVLCCTGLTDRKSKGA